MTSDVIAVRKAVRAKGKRPATVDKCRQVLNQTLALGYADKHIPHNPTVGLPKRAASHSDPAKRIVRRHLSIEQLDFLEKCMDPWWRLAVRVQIELGCRIGELAALHVGDVDLTRGVVYIRGSMKKRGGVIGKTKTDAGIFAAVARRAGVSTDFLYNTATLRSKIADLRTAPSISHTAEPKTNGDSSSSAIRPLSSQLKAERRHHQEAVLSLESALAAAHGENLQLRRRLAHLED